MRAYLSVLVLAVPLFTVSTARADAVSPPPLDCSEGSVAVDFCHGPETCRILACVDDGDCGAGMRCEQRALCTRQHCCSGRGCGMPETATFYTHVSGPCGAGGTCSDGDTCTSPRVCVPGTPMIDSGTGDDSGTDGDSGAGSDAATGIDAATGEDAGGTAMDAGGGGGSTAGGCCSVIGTRPSGMAIGLSLLSLAAVVIRRARR